jgi:hypothetical protein
VEALRFKPSRKAIVASGLVGFALIAAAGLMGGKGHDTSLWTAGHDTVQALGGVVLGLTALTGIVELFIRQRWTRQLQIVEVDLLDEILHLAGAVSKQAAYILFGQAGELAKPFQLPWTFVADEDFERAKQKLESVEAVVKTLDDRRVWERLEIVRNEIEGNGGRLRDSVARLDECVSEPGVVLPLLEKVATLNRCIRILADTAPAPGDVIPSTPTQTALAASKVLDASVEVARRIRKPFEQVRGKLDDDLRDELEKRETKLLEDERVKEWTKRGEALERDMEILSEKFEQTKANLSAMQAKADVLLHGGPQATDPPGEPSPSEPAVRTESKVDATSS